MNIKLIAAALLASGVASAATPVDGWYTSLFGGYTYIPDNVSVTTNSGVVYNSTSFNNGYNVGIRGGYQSHPMRYEGEYTYFAANNKGFNVNGIPQIGITNGDSFANVIMANVYYDAPDMVPAISPFLGLGIGYAFIRSTLVSTGPFTNGAYFSASENTFAYQGTAGFTFNFSENYAANIAYRFISTANNDVFGKVYQAHLASGGVVYHFDQGNYK